MPRGRKRKCDGGDSDKEDRATAVSEKNIESEERVADSLEKAPLSTKSEIPKDVPKNSPKKKRKFEMRECSVILNKLSQSEIDKHSIPSVIITKSKNEQTPKTKLQKNNTNTIDQDLMLSDISVDMKMAIMKYSSQKPTSTDCSAVRPDKKNSPKKINSSEFIAENEVMDSDLPVDMKMAMWKYSSLKPTSTDCSAVHPDKKNSPKKIKPSEFIAENKVSKQSENKKSESKSLHAVKEQEKLAGSPKAKIPVKKGSHLMDNEKPTTSKKQKMDALHSNKAESCDSKKLARNKNIVKTVESKKSVKTEINSDSSESESDWEEVKEKDTDGEGDELENYKPEIPKEGVEITLEGPKIVKRRKKKSWDQMEAIRLYINRERKELQMNKHKMHLLCLIAHGMQLNNILNAHEVRAFALSVAPTEFLSLSKKTAKIELESIHKLFNWYCDTFTVEKKYTFYHVSVSKLCRCFERREASNVQEYNMLFLIVARTLGLSVRLCHSLYPTSFKARNLLKKPKTKENDENVEAGVAEKLMAAKLKKLFDDEKLNSDSKSSKEVKDAVADHLQHEKESVLEKDTSENENAKNKKKCNASGKIKFEKNSSAKAKKSKDESSEVLSIRPQRSGNKKGYKMSSNEEEESNSDDEFQDEVKSKVGSKKSARSSSQNKSEKPKIVAKKKSKRNRKVLSSDSENSQHDPQDAQIPGVEYWLEIYCKATKKWVSIECFNRIINKPYAIEKVVTQPISYVLAFDNSSFVKDITKRYCADFLTETRKLRPDVEWWEESLLPFMPPNTKEDRDEESQMEATLLTKPLPSTIGEYKNHPLYALQRHLLKFEALYPPDVQAIGFIRKEPVYPREAVHILHSRENWVKEARMVRVGEEPYKIVKARPKRDRFTGVTKTDLPLEIFGYWQTEEYIPPIAHNGKVPRNEYGNVELFKPCMLPIGTVHLQLPGINIVARKLGIDCATAVVGFDAHKGNMCPVYDGYVICEEFQDVVMDAWNEEQDLKLKREEEKREKRIYGNWKKLIKGLQIREKIKIKYAVH